YFVCTFSTHGLWPCDRKSLERSGVHLRRKNTGSSFCGRGSDPYNRAGTTRSGGRRGQDDGVVRRGTTRRIGVMSRATRRRRDRSGALEGYTKEEIAAKLGCVRFTVDRKLRTIRRIWDGEPDR